MASRLPGVGGGGSLCLSDERFEEGAVRHPVDPAATATATDAPVEIRMARAACPGSLGLAQEPAGSRDVWRFPCLCGPPGKVPSPISGQGLPHTPPPRVAWGPLRGTQTSNRTEDYILVAVSSQSENVPANRAQCGVVGSNSRQKGTFPGDGGPPPPGPPAPLRRAALILASHGVRHCHGLTSAAPRLRPPPLQNLVAASHTGGGSQLRP